MELTATGAPGPSLDPHPDVLPIYPDDDAPIYEGYKVPLPQGSGRPFAFFADTTYGSAEGALAAADAWARREAAGEPAGEADTRNVIRIEIEQKTEERAGRGGVVRTVKARRATYGWQVRMQRQGVTHSQFFNDAHFGGREGAYAAARHWRDTRDAVLTRVDPKTALDRSRAARSQFGVPGMRLMLISAGNGRLVPYLQVSWPDGPDGHRKRTGLSLEKHDPQEATARLCMLIVAARGQDALPAEGSSAPATIPVPEPIGLTDGVADADERAALLGTFAEAYRRAWPFVQAELPALAAKASGDPGEAAPSESAPS